ncbi:MAG: hypothetical protein LH606_10295, partial [Cytophagaceae bacterium]|nr:hypothetical protein [Cytophagaceae bacterium]
MSNLYRSPITGGNPVDCEVETSPSACLPATNFSSSFPVTPPIHRPAHWLRFALVGCLVLLGLGLSLQAQAQVSGKVFRDYNNSGARDSSATFVEIGAKDVSVTVSDGTNSVTTTTSAFGDYAFPNSGVTASGKKLRIEFSNLTTGDFSGPQGTFSGTSVQFATAGSAATANFGLNYPAQYCQPNPLVTSSCFVAGKPQTGSEVGLREVLVSLPYAATGDPAHNNLARAQELGAVTGLAYQKTGNKLYSAAFTKRHVGFGPNGPGAVYVSQLAANRQSSTSNALFFNFGSRAGTDPHDANLPTTSASLASRENNVFDAVGKVGLGDIDISDDDKTLYVVNLFNRKLYSLNIATKDTVGYTIPNPCASTGSYRPFAVKYYRGKVYVGVVCTRENATSKTDTVGMKATVYQFDAGTFTQVLSFPLTYKKQPTNADLTGIPRAEYWRPWTAIYLSDREPAAGSGGLVSYPQPWLIDIEFDVNGDMLLGVRDRFGDQMGFENYKPFVTNTLLFSAISPGEILRAGKCTAANVWTIENNGAVCGGTPSASQNGQQGPGGGKYYFGDRVGQGANHGSSSLGGLALYAGSGRVIMTAMDPTDVFNTGGIKRLVNKDGSPDGGGGAAGGATLYTSGAFSYGKANGLGDVELLCNPAPIQIGNRVWKDDNRNGIQDPAEVGITSVTVGLYKNNTLISTAVTTATGEYYFSSGPGTNVANARYNLVISPDSTYQLRILTTQAAVTAFDPSIVDAGTNDGIDNDFSVSGTNLVKTFTAGESGENLHTFDAAFVACPTITFTAPANNALLCGKSTTALSVTTTALAPDSIRFVYFFEPQTGTNAYSGGFQLGTIVAGTGTRTLPAAQLPDNVGTANDTIYVYALLVAGDTLCRSLVSRSIILKPRPVATITGEDVACIGTQNLLSSLDVATSYKWFVGNNPAVVVMTPTYNPTVTTTTTYHLLITSALACTSDTADFTVKAVVCNPCVAGAGKIGGKTYRDYNGNGVRDTGEKGVIGITVKIYVCAANGSSTLFATTTTDLNGDYFVPGLTDGKPYRVEFSNLPAGFEPTIKGTNNGTTVQFVTSPTCGVSLGLNEPDTYCQTNPRLATPCYVSGDASATAPIEVLVSFNYTSPTNPVKLVEANKIQLGSVWGLAYSGARQKLYTGAFLKRHVGLGPNGLGAIYSTDLAAAANATLFVTIPNAGTIASNAARNLAAPATPSFDATAFAKVGTVGLGDVDISDDEKTLYTVNLNDKKVYIIDINTQTITGVIAVPDPGCSATGEYRPFALAYRRGKVYVGITCDASISNKTADLKSFVYEMDAVTKLFSATPVLTIPLNYPRSAAWEQPAVGLSGEVIKTHSSRWHPWASVFSPVVFDGVVVSNTNGVNTYVSHPQPILSDIDFDEKGAMILGFIDRTGHQLGDFNTDPSNSAKSVNTIVGGDILRAGQCTPGVWTLENGGSICGEVASVKQANGQGPGGGEFYYDELFAPAHYETAQGGIAVLPGSGEVTTIAMDPLAFYTGGIIRLSNTTGKQPRAGFMIYSGGRANGLFSKANGLGDLEIFCNPAPVQIGNRVWIDTNADGIQDPCELPLAGVTVQLYDSSGTLKATTVTDTKGEYYFTDKVPGQTNDTLALGQKRYVVLGGAGQFNQVSGILTVGGVKYQLTTPNTGQSPTADQNDSDASILTGGPAGLNGYAAICDTIGGPGYVDHTLDFGLKTPVFFSLGNRVFNDLDNSGTQNGAEPGINGVKLCLYRVVGGNNVPVDNPFTVAVDTFTVTTAGGGYYRFDSLLAGAYVVKVKAANFGAGQSLNGLISSTGAGQEANPNLDVDRNDNGLDALDAGGNVCSGTVTLGPKEPTGEVNLGPGDAAKVDSLTNLTVDFGFKVDCVKPTRLVTVTDPNCLILGNITLTSTNGDKYGISNSGTYTGAAYATATAVPGTLPTVIKSNITNLADSTYTIRVFLQNNTCFRDTVVTVKAAPIKPTVSIQPGSPVCSNNGTTYTIKFIATGGLVTTVPSGLIVTGDSIAGIPVGTASVQLIVTSLGGCIATVTVQAPVCVQPKGSIGNFVCKHHNNDGIQQIGAPGGAKGGVRLFKEPTPGVYATVDSTLTNGSGKYGFDSLLTGNYKVRFVKTSFPAGCDLSQLPNVATPGDSLDSDASPTDGLTG